MIDIVVVNLYPFERYKRKQKNNEIIEMIDVGGQSLLRAAAKNFRFVTPLIDVIDYKKLINNLKKNKGTTDVVFRKKMAQKVFKKTAQYDKNIYKWFSEK